MYRLFFSILSAALWCTAVSAATVSPSELSLETLDLTPKWYHVGGDPCRENPDCTADWAFNRAATLGVLPATIAKQATKDFETALNWRRTGDEPNWQTFYVCQGDVLASAFGAKKLRFVPKIEAAFEGCTLAHGWTYYDADSGMTYEVFRVVICANYGVRVRQPKIAIFVPAPKPETPVLNVWGETPWCCTTTTTRGGGGKTPVIPIPTPFILLGGAVAFLGLLANRGRTRRV